jgi:hypothetical protein
MSVLEVVVLVFAGLGVLGTACTALGALLPASSSVGNFFRTVGVDIKAILKWKKTAKGVAKTV